MIVFLLIVLLLVAILVGLTIHEFGHFVFAKIFKVSVKEFAVGIGPKIFSHQFKNMRFSLNLLPIMAFVRIDSERSLRLFGQLKDEYKKELDEYYNKYKTRIDNKNSYFFVEKNGKKSPQSNWLIFQKYNSLLKKVERYNMLSTLYPNSKIVDDIAKWKQLLIYFGGIFFNIILFAIFYLIQYFGFNYLVNPFEQVGQSFLLILKNMVFYNAWTTGVKSAGTAFGSVAEISNQGLIQNVNVSLTTVNYFAIFNIMLFLFNFIPIPPLDGYRIVCVLFANVKKIKVSEKSKNIFEICGMLLMFYIFATAIIADFLV
ncbi:MAG: site-2 protease family protein [Malacoplasma sp.]|nr:site-2 protease family protein [Malacoplasma sp.]